MGVVYKVLDQHLNRVLVAKTILVPDTATPQEQEEFRERFLREANLTSQLNHPNIAHVYDRYGDWIIMEFVDGPTLRELLDEGLPPIGLTLEIARQILRALGYLHRKGSIHRDISPENLMLTQDPEGAPLVKLIDLGIARSIADSGPQLTAKGGFIGKPRYAAPEHLDDREPLEVPSDIYSLGIVLYELLTGVHPFRGRTASLRPGGPRPSPLSFKVSDPRGRVPTDLRAVVIKAIAEEPERRFGSAEALASEIAKIQSRFPLDPEVTEPLGKYPNVRPIELPTPIAGELTYRSMDGAPPAEETRRSPAALLKDETKPLSRPRGIETSAVSPVTSEDGSPQVPTGLRAVVSKATIEEPERRSRSAEALDSEVAKTQSRLPLGPEVTEPLSRVQPQVRPIELPTPIAGELTSHSMDGAPPEETRRSPGALLQDETKPSSRPSGIDTSAASPITSRDDSPRFPSASAQWVPPFDKMRRSPRTKESNDRRLLLLLAAICILVLLSWAGATFLLKPQSEFSDDSEQALDMIVEDSRSAETSITPDEPQTTLKASPEQVSALEDASQPIPQSHLVEIPAGGADPGAHPKSPARSRSREQAPKSNAEKASPQEQEIKNKISHQELSNQASPGASQQIPGAAPEASRRKDRSAGREPASQTPAPQTRRPPPKQELRIEGGNEFFESEPAVATSDLNIEYPVAASGTGTWAEVVVGFIIDETGSVLNPTIENCQVRGSAQPFLFQDAALAAVRRARFRPAKEKGVAVRSWTTVTLTFEATSPGS